MAAPSHADAHQAYDLPDRPCQFWEIRTRRRVRIQICRECGAPEAVEGRANTRWQRLAPPHVPGSLSPGGDGAWRTRVEEQRAFASECSACGSRSESRGRVPRRRPWTARPASFRVRYRSYIVIPARLASTRLPRKLLLSETGKPLIQHTYESALRATRPLGVCVAADHARTGRVRARFRRQGGDDRPAGGQRHGPGGGSGAGDAGHRHFRQRPG